MLIINPIIPITIANMKLSDLYKEVAGDPGLPTPPGPPGVPGIGDRFLSVFDSVLAVLGDLDLRGIYFYSLFLFINKYNK